MPATPLGSDVVVMANGAGLIVMLSGFVAETGVGAESVTLTVKLEVPAVVGVPEIVPELLNDSPAGKDDPVAALQVSAPAPPAA